MVPRSGLDLDPKLIEPCGLHESADPTMKLSSPEQAAEYI